jgi:hypothetical protein
MMILSIKKGTKIEERRRGLSGRVHTLLVWYAFSRLLLRGEGVVGMSSSYRRIYEAGIGEYKYGIAWRSRRAHGS